MQSSYDDAFGVSNIARSTPPMRAYGLSPGAGRYRLADLRCAPGPHTWRVSGVYSEFAVGLVLDGAFDYAGAAGAGVVAVPGSFVFANQQEEFACRHLSPEGNRRLVLFLSRAAIEEAASDLSLDAARFPFPAAPPSRLTPAVSAHMLRVASKRDGEEAALAVIEAAFCADSMGARAMSAPPDDKRRIVEVVRYVNDNFASPCMLDDLAAIARMSRFRFARRFRAITGQTANQYVLNRRLSSAATRLAATKIPVLQVAYEVGFNDLSYFYARFKATFGLAPGVWRRAQRV